MQISKVSPSIVAATPLSVFVQARLHDLLSARNAKIDWIIWTLAIAPLLVIAYRGLPAVIGC